MITTVRDFSVFIYVNSMQPVAMVTSALSPPLTVRVRDNIVPDSSGVCVCMCALTHMCDCVSPPLSGDPCHVECGTPRLLSNFTVADLRVTEQYLATNPSNSGGLLCLWIIDPLQQTRFSTRVHNTSSNISSSSINNYFLHIQINSVANSSNRLLIYRGLPSLLTLPESNISHSSITNSSIPSSDYQYNLIGSLSGRQLLDNSLVIKDNVLTLVYLYSGNGTESAAINISFCVNSADTNSTDNQVSL